MNVRSSIIMRDGVQVKILVTPALYGVAKRRGIDLTVSGDNAEQDVFETYTKILYCAAINAWEVDMVDSPEIGVFPYKYSDIVDYIAEDPARLGGAISFIYEALTGKPLKEGAEAHEVKKKSSGR